MEPECCGICNYFKPKLEQDGSCENGLCRRFPAIQRKPVESWCGEFKPVEKKTEEKENLDINWPENEKIKETEIPI